MAEIVLRIFMAFSMKANRPFVENTSFFPNILNIRMGEGWWGHFYVFSLSNVSDHSEHLCL